VKHIRNLYKQKKLLKGAFFVAVWTGLEPATPCVTGMYSNQLNYQTIVIRVQIYKKNITEQAYFVYFIKYFYAPIIGAAPQKKTAKTDMS
jgi:hypothetical protein